MRILICGSRQWHDEEAIRTVLLAAREEARAAGEEFVVIHGACPDGADFLADRIAREFGLTPDVDLIREPAQWGRYKKAAGPIRNQEMLDKHHPTVVHAFRYGTKSSGTDDMVRRARKADVPTHVHTPRVHA
jgi:hypothetical protein